MNGKTWQCECGAPLVLTTEPEEMPDGTILGDTYFKCSKCNNWYSARYDIEKGIWYPDKKETK